jgi:hypothetical protein
MSVKFSRGSVLVINRVKMAFGFVPEKLFKTVACATLYLHFIGYFDVELTI